MKQISLYIMFLFLPATLLIAQQEKSEAEAYLELAEQLVDTLPDSALYFANQAELILQKADPDQLLPFLYKQKGIIYEEQMQTDRSLFYYRKAYDAFIKMEDHMETGDCANRLGGLYYELGDFSEAYFFFMQSLNAFERENDRQGIARMENNLGIVSHEMGKLDEALKHYRTAFGIYAEKGDTIAQCRSLNNIGLIYYDRQVYDSALMCFNEALAPLEELSQPNATEQYILSSLYNNMALAYSDKEEYQLALDFLQRGLELAQELGDMYYIGSVYINLGATYGDLGSSNSALFYLHRALKISKDMGFRHLELDVYDELAQLHAGTGSYASAYNWQLRYDTVYKELFNENQSAQIARLRSRYEQELKDNEIAQLQSESQVQKTLNKVFVGFIVLIVVLVVIVTVNLRSNKIRNRNLAERNQQVTDALKKLSESEKELQRLNQSKDRIFTVIAHDLRNPVAAVSGFSELLHQNFEQFPVETQKGYLLQIIQGTQRIQDMLENLLVWARSQMEVIKYEPEKIRIRTVIEECIRELKANLDYKEVSCMVKVDKNCSVFADRSMIHTIFRNLITNAVKFSFPGAKVRITSQVKDDMCSITVRDEGIGIQPEVQEKLFDSNQTLSTPGTKGESGSGLGLIICQEFVKKNNGTISLESESGNGSSFTVTLPLSKNP